VEGYICNNQSVVLGGVEDSAGEEDGVGGLLLDEEHEGVVRHEVRVLGVHGHAHEHDLHGGHGGRLRAQLVHLHERLVAHAAHLERGLLRLRHVGQVGVGAERERHAERFQRLRHLQPEGDFELGQLEPAHGHLVLEEGEVVHHALRRQALFQCA
jgi:hypothetical protein